MAQARCVICCMTEVIDDYILTVFPESEVICPKCKKSMMIGDSNMTTRTLEIDKKEEMHPKDPRPDLNEDAFIWREFLKRIYSVKKELYFVFHGFRCAGSKFVLDKDNIKFIFSDEFSKEIIDKVRNEHLIPNKDLIMLTLKILAKDLNKDKSITDCPF